MASLTSLSTTAAAAGSFGVRFREVSGDRLQQTRCVPPLPAANAPLLVQPFAKRICDLTGKKANNGYRVSFSHHRTKHLQGVNLQYKRLWWEEANRFVKMRLSTKALKTVDKKGLSVMAREEGIDLLEYVV